MRLMVYALLLISFAAACTPPAQRIAWTIDFATGAPRPPDIASVHAWIRPGGCDGGDAIYLAVLTPSGPMAAQPPHLADGTWGFGADALDGACQVVARACEDVVVPSTSEVTLLLEAVEPPIAGCAPSAVCRAGVCVSALDAGTRDSGVRDASTRDAGGCPSAETQCTNVDDDDCDGLTDCADPDCAGQTCGAGARCGGGVCCSTCVNTAGTCIASPGPLNCGAGGEDCVRCADCEACTSGVCGGVAPAGSACPGGTCLGSTVTTCCTGCISGSVTTGTCELGTTNVACGDNGDSCVSCGAGTGCTERGECCDGCTISTGACRGGTYSFQCGNGGAACEDCATGVSCCPVASGGGMCGGC